MSSASDSAGERSESGQISGRRRILLISVMVAVVVLSATIAGIVFYGGWMDSDSIDEPSEDIVISDDVRLPEEDDSITEILVSSNSITYVYDDIPQELDYSVGDIIVGSTDLGYLRRIVGIEEDGNTVTIQTENATLEEAIRKGTLSFAADLNDSAQVVRASSELQTASVCSDDFEVLGIDVPVNETYYIGDVKIHLYGQVNLSITLTLEIGFDWFSGLTELYFTVNTYTYFELHFIASSSANFTKEWTVYEHWFPTYTVMVGQLPVFLTPQVEFIVNATGGMSSTLTAGVNGTITTTSGIEYSNGYWSVVDEYTRDFDYESPVLSGTAFLRLNTSTPRTTLWVYGMVGPYFTLQPWASFDAEGQATLDEISLSWNLDVGLKGKIGVRIEVFSVKLADYSFDLFGFTWNIANEEIYLSAPSAPRNLVGIPGDELVTLSWDKPISEGGLAITEYRIYRSTVSGAQEFLSSAGLSMTYADHAVSNTVTYYYTVTVKNSLWESEMSEEIVVTPTAEPMPPSAPTNLLATQEGASVSLTWDSPLSEGSSPLSGYMIYRGGAFLADTEAVNEYIDGDVNSGATYSYRVTAFNDVGESAFSNEAVITVEVTIGPDGIFAIGGRIDDQHYTDVNELLAPNQTDELVWSPQSSLGLGRYGICAATYSGQIFVFGGGYAYNATTLDRVDIYSPSTDTWAEGSTMPANRSFAAAATVGNLIYVIGGVNGTAFLDRTDVYNPVEDVWTIGPPMSIARSRLATVAIGDCIYAMGGNSDSSTSLDLVECLDTSTMTWTVRQPLTEVRNSLAAAALNGLVYAVGGHQNPGAYIASLSVYYPDLDKWVSMNPMSTPRSELGAVAYEGKIWAIGGQGGPLSTTSAVEVFDPTTSTWSYAPAMPTARCGLAVSTLTVSSPPIETSFSDDFEAYSSIDDEVFEEVWTKHAIVFPEGSDSALIETQSSGNKVLWGSATNVPNKAYSQIFDARGVYAENFVLEYDVANITWEGTGDYKILFVGMDFRASEETGYRFALVYSQQLGGAAERIYKMSSGRQWPNATVAIAQTEFHPYSFPDSHHIRIVCCGPDLSVYLDHGTTPILSVTDGTYLGGFIGTYLEAGNGGLGQFTGSRHVDNITLELSGYSEFQTVHMPQQESSMMDTAAIESAIQSVAGIQIDVAELDETELTEETLTRVRILKAPSTNCNIARVS